VWTFTKATAPDKSPACKLKVVVYDKATDPNSVSGVVQYKPMENVDWPDSDLEKLLLPHGGEYQHRTLCKEFCEADAKCKAWTYVRRGFEREHAVCKLKSVVPYNERSSPCCVSALR
jgi:PAN domain-containing protein